MSRTLHITLPAVDRDSEDFPTKALEINQRYRKMQPRLIGGMLNLLVHILKHKDEVRLKSAPRLIKLAKYMTAAESFFGWEAGAWLAAAKENSDNQFSELMAINPVAAVVIEYIKENKFFEGTMSQLLSKLAIVAPVRSKAWPQSGKKLANEIRKIENELKKAGIRFARSSRGADGQKYILEYLT